MCQARKTFRACGPREQLWGEWGEAGRLGGRRLALSRRCLRTSATCQPACGAGMRRAAWPSCVCWATMRGEARG
eukprot:scaffold225712_cov32-Tisochrysis_lutea.AAC.7